MCKVNRVGEGKIWGRKNEDSFVVRFVIIISREGRCGGDIFGCFGGRSCEF